MQDFNRQKAEEFHYSQLAEPVRYFKDDEGGTEKMCEMVRDYGNRREQAGEDRGRKEGRMEGLETGLAKGRTEGLAKGRLESARDTARALLILGANTVDQISLATQLPIEEVRQMEKELKA